MPVRYWPAKRECTGIGNKGEGLTVQKSSACRTPVYVAGDAMLG